MKCRLVPAVLLLLPLGAPLFAAPPEPPRRDLHGDALPAGAVLRLGTVRLRHGSSVKAVAFAPDGKTLASAAWYGAVCVWDAETGREVRRLTGLEWPAALAFSPDGKALAA